MIETKRKGQEEIVGFVIIVVIVAVIAMVFLGISLRTNSAPLEKKSTDISAFLESAMEFTTDCSIREPAYEKLKDLLRDCYLDSLATCTSGERVCSAMNRTLTEVIEAGFKIGPDRPYKGYILNSTFASRTSASDLFYLSRGNCSFNLMGGETFVPAGGGNVKTILKLCY